MLALLHLGSSERIGKYYEAECPRPDVQFPPSEDILQYPEPESVEMITHQR